MADSLSKEKSIKIRLQQILTNKNLNVQRSLIRAIAADLNVDSLDCAAALLYLVDGNKNSGETIQNVCPTQSTTNTVLPIRMVRYRLDIGRKHKLTLEMLKQVLVEESGVDKNNITNVDIRELYTLIELPDAMPADIFQHLKFVEINQQKLDIRRVKTRNNKKRGKNNRRGQRSDPLSAAVVL